MKFRELLVGKNEIAQQALDEFFESIKHEDEKILWYPSAGCDYRDLVETRPERLVMHGIEEVPNIICHTDYYYSWAKLDKAPPPEGRVLFEGKGSKIVLLEQHSLCFTELANIDYHSHYYRRYYNSYFDPKPEEPTVYFMKIKIYSEQVGEIDTHVFFFIFENYHFLEELVLKHRLPITHFIKVREGCGFGGCKNSISVFYGLLGTVGVKYLLVDGEIHYDATIHDHLTVKWGINHKKFLLSPLHCHQTKYSHNYTATHTVHWSHNSVNAFKVELLEGDLTKEDLDDALTLIAPYFAEKNILYISNELFAKNDIFSNI